MASKVDIINLALAQLGVATITSLSDASPQSRLASRTYDELLEEVLRDHPWNFATTRVSLAVSTTAPDWGFDYAYPVPSDYLRLVEVYNPSELDYRVERTADGRVIITDIEAPLKIRYTAFVTDPNLYDAKFKSALAARYAMEWAEPLSARPDLRKEALALYPAKVSEAKSVDGQEDQPTEVELAGAWVASRY